MSRAQPEREKEGREKGKVQGEFTRTIPSLCLFGEFCER